MEARVVDPEARLRLSQVDSVLPADGRRPARMNARNPATVLSRLHRHLCPGCDSGIFLACCRMPCGMVEPCVVCASSASRQRSAPVRHHSHRLSAICPCRRPSSKSVCRLDPGCSGSRASIRRSGRSGSPTAQRSRTTGRCRRSPGGNSSPWRSGSGNVNGTRMTRSHRPHAAIQMVMRLAISNRATSPIGSIFRSTFQTACRSLQSI